jgi:hypothetical protein
MKLIRILGSATVFSLEIQELTLITHYDAKTLQLSDICSVFTREICFDGSSEEGAPSVVPSSF